MAYISLPAALSLRGISPHIKRSYSSVSLRRVTQGHTKRRRDHKKQVDLFNVDFEDDVYLPSATT